MRCRSEPRRSPPPTDVTGISPRQPDELSRGSKSSADDDLYRVIKIGLRKLVIGGHSAALFLREDETGLESGVDCNSLR